jgi:glutamate synthase (NADPH/NADH) large chain
VSGSPADGPDDPTRDELLANPFGNDTWRLKTLITRHAEFTNSSRAQEILDNFDDYLLHCYKVVPVEYRRALAEHAVAAGSA